MVQPGLPATRLLNLPQRPPTPPRESENNNLHTELTRVRHTLSDHLGENTPPQNSPSSSVDSTQRSSSKSAKKVAWSAWNEYKDPPSKGSTPQNSLRQVPSSGELKPAKSILKPYNGINAVDRKGNITKSAAPHTYPNFAIMLESIVKQLAGEDRNSRIDAYLTLSGVLKASENIPDLQALRDKTVLLSQFVQRDISAKTFSGALDTGLINNALILLACLIWKPAVADCFNVEFCTYIVEHCINALKEPETPKDVVKHLLFILGQQSFSSKTMTSDRVRRLIEALRDLDNQLKARSIILGRIAVYRKLLKQTRIYMLSNLCWIEDLFADMVNNIREVRTPAVSFGFEASLQFGAEKQVSRAIIDLFGKEQDEATYGACYKESLISMIQQKLDGHLVPQIWSIVVLFMRARPHQLEYWEFTNPWLQVIEKCFNSVDHEIKIQAYLAWNRFVFAIHLSEATTPAIIKVLGKALEVPLLKRKMVGRNAKEARQAIIGNVCNLLYYALRPGSASSQLDMYWDEYVVQLVGNALVFNDKETAKVEQESLSQACEILAALLDTTPKAWNNNRANIAGTVKTEELPGIDVKWIRKNAQRVFKVLGPLVEKCFRDLKTWESSIVLIWSRFISCIASAGAKEVKVSNDTMSSMASIFDLLYKLWENGPRNLSNASYDANVHFLKAFANLIVTTTSTLGLLPFTEKLLSMGPHENFAVVATPSHSPFKARGEVKYPLHHLFILMTRPSTEIAYDTVYEETVKVILNPFFEVRKTRRSQSDLLIDLFQLLPRPVSNQSMSIALWKVIASYSIAALNYKITSGTSSNSSGSHDQPLGAEYRSFDKILGHGALLSSSPLPIWRELFVLLCDQVVLDAGESGRAIAVIEPLARILGDNVTANNLHPNLEYCPILLSKAVYPRDKQALDASRRLLWGTSNTNTKSSSFDPYSHLYMYTKLCLNELYKSVNVGFSLNVVELLTYVADMIPRCPTMLAMNLLMNLQEGVAPWLLDEDGKLGSRSSTPLAPLVVTLWTHICALIGGLSQKDSSVLRDLEPLLSSAFGSKHRTIVNATITLWNSTFGSQATLEYPPRVLVALRRLQPVTDLQLPSFPNDPDDKDVSVEPTFLDDSQDDNVPYVSMNIDSSHRSTGRRKSALVQLSPLPQLSRRISPQVVLEIPQSSSSRKRPFDGTPEPTKRKAFKKDTTPKLRHDNSQIQFTTIDSSPLGDASLDSQLLTERQREVKERQKEADALFSDLRSSPGPNTEATISKLGRNSELLNAKQISPNVSTTPLISRHDKVSYDNYITSSPTPRRGNIELQIDSDAFEPPSSPPEALFHKLKEENDPLTAPADRDAKYSGVHYEESQPLAILRSNAVSLNSTDLGPSAQVVDDAMYMHIGNSTTSGDLTDDTTSKPYVQRPSTPLESSEALADEQQTKRTPKEIFVDALSSPAPPTPTRDVNSDDLYADALPTPLRTSVLERATAAFDSPRAVEVSPNGQHDLQTSFSFNEADEDSILRLITKFDGATPRQKDSSMSNEEDLIQSSLLSEALTVAGPADAEKENNLSSSRLKKTNMAKSASSQPSKRLSPVAVKPETKKKKSSRTTSRLARNIFTASTIPETQLMEVQVAEDIRGASIHPIDGVGIAVVESSHLISSDLDSEVYDSVNRVRGVDPMASSIEINNQEHQPSPVLHHIHNGQKIGSSVADVASERWTVTNESVSNGSPKDNNSGLPSMSTGSPLTGQKIIASFEQIIDALGSIALTRAEVQKVENLLWDVKGELYAAEKRGRTASKSG